MREEEEEENRRLLETKEALKGLQNFRVHIKFEVAALLHYAVNYNLMSNVEIKWPDIIQNVFKSMRCSEDTS